MTYQTPARSGEQQYKAAFSSYFNDENGAYGEAAIIDIQFRFEAAVHGPNWEAVADEQWQSFVDYVRDWPGFATSDPSYGIVGPTTFSAGKTYPVTEEVTTP
jgi:hypothetical protein